MEENTDEKRSKSQDIGTEYEAITDEDLLTLVESGLRDAAGDWIAGTSLSGEREKASLEYGMLATGHLSPQGVSQIVSSDTVEVVEGYTAVLAELLYNNNKLAKFTPMGKSPKDYHNAKKASEITNYAIFKHNPGWSLLNTWTKAGLLYKSSPIRWDFVKEHEFSFEEFDEIDQMALDLKLSEEDIESVGTLEYSPEMRDINGEKVIINIYRNVRLRKKIKKDRVQIDVVPVENFRISRDAATLDDATFIGIETEMTRSEIRNRWPHVTIDWNMADDIRPGTIVSSEETTRKVVAAVEAHVQGRGASLDTEQTKTTTVVECWMRVDRDGDGIAELKHLIYVGKCKIVEEDVSCVNLACFVPFEIPYEFVGLSGADMVRPSTLANTAILRGFVENTYMTNYAPKLADPNVVDFSALQNMKPKQLIPTNGNPNGAVSVLQSEQLSPGTVPLLEYLQLHKEQATGLSKAAQGLNDVLYVSGNSEQKVTQVQSAAQVRIQYMARRLVETGIKRLVEGVYKCIRRNMDKIEYYDAKGLFQSVSLSELPENMLMEVDADVGDMGNTSMLRKMDLVGKQIIPGLQSAGAGGAVHPAAAVKIAAETLAALDLDPLDYMVDYTDPKFLEQAEASRKTEAEAADKMRKLEELIKNLDIEQRKATMALTNIQSKNALQDNARQMVVAIDKHYQEWAKLSIDAAKAGVTNFDPENYRPKIEDIWMTATKLISMDASAPLGSPEVKTSEGTPAALPDEVVPERQR